MSRKHKYKVWDKVNNCMDELDGYDLYLADGKIYEVSLKGYWGMEHLEKIDVSERYILLEYVGFKDKNNKEIYEGYIDSSGYVVTYLANLHDGLGMNAGWYLQRDNFESWSELECNEDIEIIGNIFENPEKAINNCNTDYTTSF
jgi:hypothetical protein